MPEEPYRLEWQNPPDGEKSKRRSKSKLPSGLYEALKKALLAARDAGPPESATGNPLSDHLLAYRDTQSEASRGDVFGERFGQAAGTAGLPSMVSRFRPQPQGPQRGFNQFPEGVNFPSIAEAPGRVFAGPGLGVAMGSAVGAAGGDQEKSPLDAILERLAGGGQGGPAGISLPDRAAYIAPYDEAERRANEAYQRSVPELKAIYSGLRDEVGALDDSYEQNRAMLAQEREDQRAARLAEAEAPMVSQAAMMVDGGAAATGAAEAQAQHVGDLKAQFDAQRNRDAMLDRGDEDMDRMVGQHVGSMEAASGANARNNLDAILQQIGMGRAEAERAYQSDLQSVQARNAAAQADYQEKQRAQAQQDFENYIKMQEGIAKSSMTSGRAQFERMVEEQGLGTAKYPTAYRAFTDIINNAKGKGAMGKANAMAILQQAVDSGLTDGSMYGKRLRPEVIRQWIDMYYDEDERLDDDAFRRAGGDPRALGFLNGGISDPNLLRLLGG